jgi:hypothetical protein
MKPTTFKFACWAAYGLLAASLLYCLSMPALTLLYINPRNTGFLDLPMAAVLELWEKYLPWALGAGAIGIVGLQGLARLSRRAGADKLDPEEFFVRPRQIPLGKTGKKRRKTIAGKE